jgi:hypothetical protein
MLKHVGMHNRARVVVVFREVPNEDHMALVTYTDNLPTQVHDDIMAVVEDTLGQSARHLGDALHRKIGTDSQNILVQLHNRGWLKKVRTQDVILTPTPGGEGARLDEVNKIIRDLDAGGEAAGELARLDASAGLADPDKKAQAVIAARAATGTPGAVEQANAAANGPLTNGDIAKNLLSQAASMKSQVDTLTVEMARLTEEAQGLDPSLKPAKKRGRPRKVAA